LPPKSSLERELMAFVKDLQKKKIKIDWQFSKESVGDKLNRHYSHVHAANAKYKQTWFPMY
jgi:hypothetical protein